jgi:adenine-specific DNA-methyltransferase
MAPQKKIRHVVIKRGGSTFNTQDDYVLFHSDVDRFLDGLPKKPIFDLVVTSPPYNIGKTYETKSELSAYEVAQSRIVRKIIERLKPTGSICWQVGNFILNGSARTRILPLDFVFHPIFLANGLALRNRIIWRFGHGLHCKYRFSGRYEVVLWYTKTDNYYFDLEGVRVPPKYPGKRYYKGPNRGKLSSNPSGKNPEDVWQDLWDIPNVKANHREKTEHPCQFPVGLAERLILALARPGALVFDPFCGVASTGVAAAIHGRRFVGCDTYKSYLTIGQRRINEALAGEVNFRPHSLPVYDHTKSPLSRVAKS